VADEVGPSIRWATAKVEKNERRGGDFGDSGGGGRPATNEPPAGYDEEPF
jgi:single-strand DNA-binding protein